jgi:hypothetical protein
LAFSPVQCKAGARFLAAATPARTVFEPASQEIEVRKALRRPEAPMDRPLAGQIAAGPWRAAFGNRAAQSRNGGDLQLGGNQPTMAARSFFVAPVMGCVLKLQELERCCA